MTTNKPPRPSQACRQAVFAGVAVLTTFNLLSIAKADASSDYDNSKRSGVKLSGAQADAKTEYARNPLTAAEQTSATMTTSEPKESKKLKDGLYLILRENSEKSKLEPAAPSEEIVINDFEFLDPSERETTSYIVVSNEQFIPFIFSKDPSKGTDDKGRAKLLLQLAEDQMKPLELFTEKYTGKSVAIIVGGKVVTTHKIREAIKGGKIQITRCSDFGCDVLYTQLLKDAK